MTTQPSSTAGIAANTDVKASERLELCYTLLTAYSAEFQGFYAFGDPFAGRICQVQM